MSHQFAIETGDVHAASQHVVYLSSDHVISGIHH